MADRRGDAGQLGSILSKIPNQRTGVLHDRVCPAVGLIDGPKQLLRIVVCTPGSTQTRSDRPRPGPFAVPGLQITLQLTQLVQPLVNAQLADG
jgi:hypothetical protein